MAPFELRIGEDGGVILPLSLLAQAGLDPGEVVLAVAPSDGRLVLRRLGDAVEDMFAGLPPA